MRMNFYRLNMDQDIPKTITKEYFKSKVGRDPIEDEIERCNCTLAGKVGHFSCGWCNTCDLPRFICGHMLPYQEGGIINGEYAKKHNVE